MEIPSNLKTLYNHWSYQTERSGKVKLPRVSIDESLFAEIKAFATERQLIWERKLVGESEPYTEDPILRKYRFCNIYRELDRQTIAIHTLLKMMADSFELWLLNLMYCRFVCNPDTVKATGFLSFDSKNNKEVRQRLKELPSPKYGVAYIFPINTIQRTQFNTRERFFTEYLPLVVQKCASLIKEFNDKSVVDALKIILPVFGFNLKFHWTEILIDIAYQYPEYLNLYKQFPVGPGSTPTMKSLSPKEDPEFVCLSLLSHKIPNFPYLEYEQTKVKLSAENWEGIGCEFRKYTNLNKGEGRHRMYR